MNSFYRDTYLKSDHWKDLRLRKMVSKRAICCLCGESKFFNDVHHIVYRNLYDVRLSDLRVLCRRCHSLVHDVLDSNVSIRSVKASKSKWNKVAQQVRSQLHTARQQQRKQMRKLRNVTLHRLGLSAIIPSRTWYKFVRLNPLFTDSQIIESFASVHMHRP